MGLFVPMLQITDIWRCCSGRERMDVLGMSLFVLTLPRMDIWKCCSGRERTNVLGTRTYALVQLITGIWKCCSGRERADVLGIEMCWFMLWKTATRTFWIGRGGENARLESVLELSPAYQMACGQISPLVFAVCRLALALLNASS